MYAVNAHFCQVMFTCLPTIINFITNAKKACKKNINLYLIQYSIGIREYLKQWITGSIVEIVLIKNCKTYFHNLSTHNEKFYFYLKLQA